MNDKIAKARATASKWEAAAVKLRAEIAKRAASGRATKALARARDQLAKAERRLAEAADRAAEIETRQRTSEASRANGAAIAARFAHLDGLAPQVAAKWKAERKDEAKRLAKRRKALHRRTHKDGVGGDPMRLLFGSGRRRRSYIATADEPLEAETWPTGPIIPYVPATATAIPARAGLLPGDFRLIPKIDDFDRYRAPKDWTSAHVAERMVEAFRVIHRLPMVTRPKAFGAMWPEYIHEGVELAYQAGAGTLHQNRGRMIRGTSADEVARMNDALAWPLTYLTSERRLARALNEWAFDQSIGDGSPLDHDALEAATVIADRLNKAKVKVT